MRTQTRVGRAQRLGAAGTGCPSSSLPEGEGRGPSWEEKKKSDFFFFRATSQGSEDGQYVGAGGRGALQRYFGGVQLLLVRIPRNKSLLPSTETVTFSPSALPSRRPHPERLGCKNKIKQNLLLWQPLSHMTPPLHREDFFLLPLLAFIVCIFFFFLLSQPAPLFFSSRSSFLAPNRWKLKTRGGCRCAQAERRGWGAPGPAGPRRH